YPPGRGGEAPYAVPLFGIGPAPSQVCSAKGIGWFADELDFLKNDRPIDLHRSAAKIDVLPKLLERKVAFQRTVDGLGAKHGAIVILLVARRCYRDDVPKNLRPHILGLFCDG